MNYFQVTSHNVGPVLKAPTSKSYCNRALLMAAITDEVCEISNITFCDDVLEFIDALESVGLDIEKHGSSIRVKNSFPKCEIPSSEICEVASGEGGTTNRFLICLLSLGTNSYKIIPHSRFLMRPLDSLCNTLNKLNVDIKINADSILVKGPMLPPQELEIKCEKTTQVASALMMVLHGKTKVLPINITSSKNYLQMTEHVIKHFRKNKLFEVPADYSSLSYLLAWAGVSEKILIENCRSKDELQGDSSILDILSGMGVILTWTKLGLEVSPTYHKKPFHFNASNALDLVPTLVFLAAITEGISTITHIKNLKYKESDRISAIIKTLAYFGVEVYYAEEQDILTIKGRNELKKVQNIVVAPDHRIAMMTILLLKYNGGGGVYPTDVVNKSFPDFCNIFQ